MSKFNDRLKATEEGRRLIERERVWMEATENLCRAMESKGVSRSQLAERLGVSRAWVTELLGGTHNVTLGTLSDAFFALGHSLHVSYGDATDAVRLTPVDSSEAVAVTDVAWTVGESWKQWRSIPQGATLSPPHTRPHLTNGVGAA
jgi:transcriptional regulator with XRE-family HTH domain